MNKNDSSLVIVGSGIKTISHISIEALSYIKHCEKILYSVNDPILEIWIQENNNNTESLDKHDHDFNLRSAIYDRAADYILENLNKYKHVCVIFYGHPTVFAKSALKAAIQAKEAGYLTKILPAISAEDCLFADLFIDPGSCGCQSFEATDFLIHNRKIDIHSHLILWQIGIIGALGNIKFHNNSRGINILTNHLLQLYPQSHEVVTYEASLYPHLEATINRFTLKRLPNVHISSLTTLYIPPIPSDYLDSKMIEALGIDIKHL